MRGVLRHVAELDAALAPGAYRELTAEELRALRERARGEAAETVHHLYMACLKGYETQATYESYRLRYQECIRMLNGMERTLEQQLPETARRWPTVQEQPDDYNPIGFPDPSSTEL